MNEKRCVCGHELESSGGHTLEVHGASLLKGYVDAELWTCPWCGRIALFAREENRRERYRAMCGGKTDEELTELPELLRDEAQKLLALRAELAAEEAQRRQEKEEARERDGLSGGGFFSGLFDRKGEEDKPSKNRPPEF